MSDDRITLNEHRNLVFGEDGRQVAFLCECADADCRAAVRLTRAEYGRLRPGVVLAPGHEPPAAASA